MSRPITQLITRAEMEALINERLPDMPPNVREAALTGATVRLLDGSAYRVPTRPEDQHATHFITARIERIGDRWTH